MRSLNKMFSLCGENRLFFVVHRVIKYKLDHVAFWLITLFFYAFTRKDLLESAGWPHFVADVLIRNLLIAATCYLNIYLLFEKLFRRGKYVAYATSLVCLVVAYTVLQIWMGGILGDTSGNGMLSSGYYNFSIGVFYIAFTLALELSKRWYRQQLLLHRVQSEKLQTELQYLKAQLNPHFLFNSLNSIFFQIDKGNVEARESLHKFSEMLRYQLYECNEDEIPIEKETSYLKSYVDLQRLRKSNKERIVFSAGENVSGFSIAPLLLLPFVENAFKHAGNRPDSNKTVELEMTRQNGSFIFSVVNSMTPSIDDGDHSGIGLKNVRRRLDLLYHNRYELDIHRSDAQYSVTLKIKIE
jgi:sensor histidine kinase YesM